MPRSTRRTEAILEAAIKEMQSHPIRSYASGGSLLFSGGIAVPPGATGMSWLGSSIFGPTITSGNSVTPALPEPKAPKMPTTTSTEPIVGYRVWTLKRYYPEGYRLDAMNAHLSNASEPYQRFAAECMASHDYWLTPAPPKRHKAPDPACTCGWHAYKTSVPLDPSDKPYVAGEVNLWGRVIEHEAGYRAEFAYPKSLVVVDGGDRAEHIATALTLTYGVPCEVWAG